MVPFRTISPASRLLKPSTRVYYDLQEIAREALTAAVEQTEDDVVGGLPHEVPAPRVQEGEPALLVAVLAVSLACHRAPSAESLAPEPSEEEVEIGYGATAVNPYLAFETIEDMHRKGQLPPELTLAAFPRRADPRPGAGAVQPHRPR